MKKITNENNEKVFTKENFEKDFLKIQNDEISIDEIDFNKKNTKAIRDSISNPESVKKIF